MAEVTPGGRWLKRRSDEHTCFKPVLATVSPKAAGDLWQCNTCRTVWQIVYEQHDGFFWRTAGSSVQAMYGKPPTPTYPS